MRRILIWLLLVGCVVCRPSILNGADAPVRLELRTDPGFPIDGHQRWITFLQKFDFIGVSFRTSRASDEPSVTNRGTAEKPSYRVVGILTEDNLLLLPGARIRCGQTKELMAWLGRFREGGGDASAGATGPFGLTPKGLTELHTDLERKVMFATRGQRVGRVVQQLTSGLAVSVEVGSAARRELRSSETVTDELKGLSRGTALAAALRPLGLGLVPSAGSSGRVKLSIAANVPVEKCWPIGFEPKGKSLGKLAPTAFEFIDVEINKTPLDETLRAIEKRIKFPILFDHQRIAQHDIDLATNVSFPKNRTFYKKIIDRLLFQVMLKCEFQIDEADQAFLWVTTIKK